MNEVVGGYLAGLAIGALIGFGMGWMLRGMKEKRRRNE